MSYYLYKGVLYDINSLKHYGVLGMKWGVRRYQNKDGTLTDAGKKMRLSKKASNYYKKEADKLEQPSLARIREIDEIVSSDKVDKMPADEISALLLETRALESSLRTLKARSKEIDRKSKLGERYIEEYAKNVPIDKILKAYSYEYAYYMHNVKGDKEWLQNWDDKKGPKFD